MSLTLCTTIMRDGLAHDVTIEFSAQCVSPGYPATYMQPGEGPEYEITFEGAELVCPEADDHGLTDAEMDTLRARLLSSHEKAREAAIDDRGEALGWDDERDHANDNGWRGLKA